MRLAGTDVWSENDIKAAIDFANNAAVSTILLRRGFVGQDELDDGADSKSWAWEPGNEIDLRIETASIAFACGRFKDGLAICRSMPTRISGPPPALTLTQYIHAATLGAIVGDIDIHLDEMRADISFTADEAPSMFIVLTLDSYPLVEQVRLAQLLIPAAFVSPSFENKVRYFKHFDSANPIAEIAASLLKNTMESIFVKTFRTESRLSNDLLSTRLHEYEACMGLLQADEEAWREMEFRAPLIDWPLLALLVGANLWHHEPSDAVLPGPASKFLFQLARELTAWRRGR